MNLKDIADQFVDRLSALYDKDEANAMFLIVLSSILNYNRADYLLKKDEFVSDQILSKFEGVLKQLEKGIPLQYILGETIFYGLPFKVTTHVLIPRPETEELVEWILQSLKQGDKHTSGLKHRTLLDIGTGSGCIAISIKKNLSTVNVSAIDVSQEALQIAKENAILNHVDINFQHCDILQSQKLIANTPYSVIVSNPPYITDAEKEKMHQNVLNNEPHIALFVSDEKPLIFYEAIADFALNNLENNGLLFFEINEYLGKEMVDMLGNKGFINIKLRKDMQGKHRMISCVKVN